TIWLGATSLGLATAWAAMHQADNEAESERRQHFVRETLSIPEKLYVPVVLGIGSHKAPLPDKERPPLDTLVSWETYDKK
ncbi:MAG: nitroreductase, partial [Dehalococcoidia bacterium]|nr:nitroreductase [Dehalococcoidia bacterium]